MAGFCSILIVLLLCWQRVAVSVLFLWYLMVESLTAFLATFVEMLQAGSGPMKGHSGPFLAN
jgi:hypothetical protein